MGAASYPMEGFDRVEVVDRLANSNWASITRKQKVRHGSCSSIKGGGALDRPGCHGLEAAQLGKRVLVLDLDLESPGLSSSLLPPDRQPTYGITDWLVEDLVFNGDTVLESMIATSELSRDGQIYVVPAHGADAGEYIAKLGRVWMPKVVSAGQA